MKSSIARDKLRAITSQPFDQSNPAFNVESEASKKHFHNYALKWMFYIIF